MSNTLWNACCVHQLSHGPTLNISCKKYRSAVKSYFVGFVKMDFEKCLVGSNLTCEQGRNEVAPKGEQTFVSHYLTLELLRKLHKISKLCKARGWKVLDCGLSLCLINTTSETMASSYSTETLFPGLSFIVECQLATQAYLKMIIRNYRSKRSGLLYIILLLQKRGSCISLFTHRLYMTNVSLFSRG